ncbi:MAG: HEPN domain-containing protein [Oligoflexia bacterium]|nr:HEPN domain-containing protein [Oligoflexia bacterium]
MSKNRFLDWFLQAQDDIEFAKKSLSLQHYSQICFLSQQASEKALKALGFRNGYDLMKTHSVRVLAEKLQINSEVTEAAKILDLYYISARYPDGLPEGAPFQAFTEEQAKQAIEKAELILNKVLKLIK